MREEVTYLNFTYDHFVRGRVVQFFIRGGTARYSGALGIIAFVELVRDG